ncbi:DUF3558 domain-containing protein [Nocardia flavorosea]|uniref:DUF3558 domain-containing protein n=1 Tax=Nocardia flavorosea TaxID=53429 RepID=UPI0018951D15|nr:DUF3558 domain-containing protein [Nocardia flavorosea]MBF6351086.1 DUF3558 domain-containing protein [Nocardia flavorosea]
MLTAVAVSACSTSSDIAGTASPGASSSIAETAPPRPTLTAPKLQPPAQEGQHVNKNRPDVVFDPCTWVSDETIREAGFDPATRERGQDFLAEWTFLVCEFESEVISLSVMSGNVTLEEEIQKSLKSGPWQRQIKVNGRDATMGTDPQLPDSCEVNIRTAVGVVFVDQLLNLQGRIQGIDPCVDIERTAALIEKEIGEGN